MSTKSKSSYLSALRFSLRNQSRAVPEPNSSPCTRARAMPEPNTSRGTHSRDMPKPNTSPRTFPRAMPEPNSSRGAYEFPSVGAITPIRTLKFVSLSDWWLTMKKGKEGLGVAGFESKGGREFRLFSSGAISERHDSVTLETFDGVTVSISGFINRSRTLQNGFSSEVCNRFLLGFPFNWKDLDEEEESIEKTHFNISVDEIPVSKFQDISLLNGCLKDKIFDDVVESLRDLVCPSSQISDKKCPKSRICNDESVVPTVEGVKTRGMRRRREDNETSIGKRVHATPRKTREREKKKN